MPALALLGFGFVLAQPATAQDDVDTEPNGIEVVQVDGLLDPANAALLTRVVQKAEDYDATLLVVQLAGTGAVDTDVDELVDLFEDASVPIGVWIGPSGSNARGASALLALTAPVVAVAPGAGIGPVYPVNFDDPGDPPRVEVEDQVRGAQVHSFASRTDA